MNKSRTLDTWHLVGCVALISLGMWVFSFNTSYAQSNTSAGVQAQLQALLAQVEQLQERLAELQAANNGSNNDTGTSVAFNRNLGVGSQGADVRALQRFLNQNSETQVAVNGPGSPGNETSYYGQSTAAAVARFQERHRSDILEPAGLSSGSGYFGASTRAKMRALAGVTGNSNSSNGDETSAVDDADFSLDDVESVVKFSIDSIPTSDADNYTVYTITLGNGDEHKVRIFGTYDADRVEQKFRDAGYGGDIDELMAMAVEESAPQRVEIANIASSQAHMLSPEVRVGIGPTYQSDLLKIFQGENDNEITMEFATGFCPSGEIWWGDNTSTELATNVDDILKCQKGEEIMMHSHEYDEGGEYTVGVRVLGDERDKTLYVNLTI